MCCIGPFAEGFYEAFGTGVGVFEDGRPSEEVNRYLAASDVAGVALLGIKALGEWQHSAQRDLERMQWEQDAVRQENLELREQQEQLRRENTELREQTEQLQRRLERLEQLVEQLAHEHVGQGNEQCVQSTSKRRGWGKTSRIRLRGRRRFRTASLQG